MSHKRLFLVEWVNEHYGTIANAFVVAEDENDAQWRALDDGIEMVVARGWLDPEKDTTECLCFECPPEVANRLVSVLRDRRNKLLEEVGEIVRKEITLEEVVS